MMNLLHSVTVQNQNQGSDGVFSHELSVNPLSVILICLRPLNETATLTNFAMYLTICDAINRVSVLFRGQSIVSMTGRDLAMLAYYRHGCQFLQPTHSDANNARRCVVLPIFLGRGAYDSKSCFPASRSGELVLELDLDDADTGYDDLQYTVETIQLIGAKPSEYERKVQLVRTNSATGINDLDVPIGNVIRGILLFGTTVFSGAAPVPSWGRVSTVVDGVEIGYAGTDFEVSLGLSALRGIQVPAYDGHQHRFEDTAGAISDVLTNAPGANRVGDDGFLNYSFLNFDPMGDDSLSINTKNVSRFQIRADVETADLVRAIPIERISL